MRILRWLGLALALFGLTLGLLIGLSSFYDGPLGPIPGGPLSGAVLNEPPDWSFFAALDSLELQVNPAKPRSLTVWLLVVDGQLYVPSGFAPVKRWPSQAVDDGRVVLRIGGKLYERRAVRVTDPAERRAAHAALVEKYSVPEADDPDTWIFRMDPRPTS